MVKCRDLTQGAENYGAATAEFFRTISSSPRSSSWMFWGCVVNKPLIKISIREENERTILEAAEAVFAEQGFSGATTAAIAARAGVPKANLHYYFSTKAALYRAVIERVLTAWLAAASSFDESDDPNEAISRYIGAKMDLARSMPLGSRIWASEIIDRKSVV